MRAARAITVVGCHAGGEIGNVVVGGVLPPPGETVFERMLALREDDRLRRLLLREPRGSVAAHANLIVPSLRPECDAGYIIMEPTEYPLMSGSNTICVATVLLEIDEGRAGRSHCRCISSCAGRRLPTIELCLERSTYWSPTPTGLGSSASCADTMRQDA